VGGQGVRPSCLGKLAIFVDQRALDRSGEAARLHREGCQRGAITHHGLVAQTLDHGRANPRVHGGDQTEKDSRCAGTQKRNVDETSPQTTLTCVLAHQARVGDPIGATDLKDGVGRRLELERGEQVVDHVLDRDRLGRGVHPPREDEDGQPFDERSDDLERGAARPDDDRSAQLDGGNAGASQDLAHLLTACQMW
jgi:hypothetical protein